MEASENRLARYLAEDGANNRTRLVVYRRMFGRVRKLWMLDMGLGINVGDFEVLTEDEYEEYLLEQVEEEMMDNGVVEISDDSDEEDVIWYGGFEGESLRRRRRRKPLGRTLKQ